MRPEVKLVDQGSIRNCVFDGNDGSLTGTVSIEASLFDWTLDSTLVTHTNGLGLSFLDVSNLQLTNMMFISNSEGGLSLNQVNDRDRILLQIFKIFVSRCATQKS